MKIDDIKKQIQEIPDNIKSEELKAFALSRKIQEIQNKRKQIEQDIFKDVCNEKDLETGKSKYTNESMREIEKSKRLSENIPFKILVEEELDKSYEFNTAKIEIEYLNKQFKSIGYLISILELEKQWR